MSARGRNAGAARTALLALALLAAGCRRQLTEIVVVVDTDLAAERLDQIDLEVQGPTRTGQVSAALTGSTAVALPLTLGLTHAGEALGPVTVTAVGRLHGAEIVRRALSTRFAPGQRLLLPLWLLARCAAMPVPADCAAATLAPEDLDPWTGTLPARDGGVPGPDGAIACTRTCAAGYACTAGVCGESVVQIASGEAHACARLAAGPAYCWGARWDGQLGDGMLSETGAASAVRVLAVADFVQITAGRGHTCGVRQNHTAVCWGRGAEGQLGNGTTSSARQPSPVVGLDGVAELAAGGEHTCARTLAGQVRCWGANEHGQLGDGTNSSRANVGAVVTLPSPAVQLVAGGAHSCARLDAGTVHCWGSTEHGQLGNGVVASGGVATPVQVAVLTDVVQLASGRDTVCARLRDGGVRCWGAGESGQLGDGRADPAVATARAVLLLSPALDVTVGVGTACARTDAPRATQCWGDDTRGQLGDGAPLQSRTMPGAVSALADAAELALGGYFGCARRASGAVVCWGENTDGQGGTGLAGATLDAPGAAVRGLP